MDSAKDSGSVKSLLDTFIRQGDLYGQVMAHETLGKIYRENSAFPDAIAEHQKALDLAKVLDDTLAVVQALNLSTISRHWLWWINANLRGRILKKAGLSP